MDILAKLRIIFWGLVIGLWGLFMYQYMSDDMSTLKRFKIARNPFESSGETQPGAVPAQFPGQQQLPADQQFPAEQPPALPAQPPGPARPAAAQQPPAQGTSLSLVTGGADIKGVAARDTMPEPVDRGEAALARTQEGGSYPAPPEGFSMAVTQHFVVYEEGPAVSKDLTDELESLHGNIMLDLVAFSPWTREKKVYIYYASDPATYHRLTGRPEWSGGAASLAERKIFVYKSDEAIGILAHELTHIYFDSFFTPSHPDPLWLSEGMATYIQAERGLSRPAWLEQNLKLLQGGSGFKLHDLVRIEDLQGADDDNVRLWYAECYSVVRFLIRMRAGESFYIFCKELRDGKATHAALYRAYGMPYNKLSALEYAWRYDLKTGKITGPVQ